MHAPPPTGAPPRASGLVLATRTSVAALLAGVPLAIADTVAVLGHPMAELVGATDVTVGLLAVWALHLCLSTLAFGVLFVSIFARRRLSGRARGVATLWPTAALALLAGMGFSELSANWPWLTRGLVVALPVAHALVVVGLARADRRRVAIAVGLVVVIAAVVLDGWTLRGVRPGVHQGLVLVAWGFALPVAFVLSLRIASWSTRDARRIRLLLALVWIAVVVFAVQTGQALRAAPAGARLVPLTMAPAAATVLEGLGPALELDGDGDPSWPAGSDCAPLDGGVSPTTPEIAGDGIDQNCLAGDPTPADVEALARALADPPIDRRAGSAAHEPATRLLLVTIDALRHDAELPRVRARIGNRCTTYEHAWSTSNATTYAMYSLFASRFPSQGVFSELGAFYGPVDDPAVRLPDVLVQAGFTTMAVAFHNRFDPRVGITRGFTEVWTAEPRPEVILGEAGAQTTARALGWLRDREAPWFLWVHYYDPHEPYLPHAEIPLSEPTPRATYLGEVAYTDLQISELLDGMADLDEVAIVLTADHGEAFGEHGQQFHATDLFDEQIRVPMWVCPPRGAPRPAGSTVASLVDVGPTLLDLAGVGRPASFVGRSLLGAAVPVPVFAEMLRGRRLQAAIDWPWKMIRYLDGDVRLLFDLREDPGEHLDRVGVEDRALKGLEVLLDTWTAMVAREHRSSSL